MITIKLSGGLGNQLFQYAFGRALSIKHATNLTLDISNYKRINTSRPYGLDVFSFDVHTVSPGFFSKIKQKLNYILEKQPSFQKEILDISRGYFIGNWQSEKYFKNIETILRTEIKLKSWSITGLSLKNKIEIETHTPVSLHVRRGDIAKNAHLSAKHGTLSIEYYLDAVTYIKKTISNPVFYIFSDDVAWVKENLIGVKPQVIISGQSTSIAEELMLMSFCKHHIIANSTFSWWAAWLNPNLHKIVVAPKKWYVANIDSSDLIPASWIKI